MRRRLFRFLLYVKTLIPITLYVKTIISIYTVFDFNQSTAKDRHRPTFMFSCLKENSTCNTYPDHHGDVYFASYHRKPVAKGDNYISFKGKLMSGKSKRRIGEKIIVKVRTQLPGRETDCDDVIKTCKDTQTYLDAFLNTLKTNNGEKIRVNIPLKCLGDEANYVADKRRKLRKDEWVLIDECLTGKFEVFVNRTGDSNFQSQILEAFCHYTYVTSGGSLLVCNLQGVCDRQTYDITGPVIHSVNKSYGEHDSGKAAIKEALQKHKCNQFCQQFMSNLRQSVVATAPPPEDRYDEPPPPYDVVMSDILNSQRSAEHSPPSYDFVVSESNRRPHYKHHSMHIPYINT